MKGGLPFISVGQGPPLVVFVAGGPTNANPTGWQRTYEVRWLAPLARAGFTVYRVNRKVGLKRGTTTMANLADDYALALEDEFANPLDVLGVSTGGMIVQQFAVNHPDLLHRLVLGGAAYRLGPVAREAERRSAEFATRGEHRRIYGSLKERKDMVVTGGRSVLIGVVLFVVGGFFFELVVGVSGFGLGLERFGWPLMVVIVGIALMIGGLLYQRR